MTPEEARIRQLSLQQAASALQRCSINQSSWNEDHRVEIGLAWIELAKVAGGPDLSLSHLLERLAAVKDLQEISDRLTAGAP